MLIVSVEYYFSHVHVPYTKFHMYGCRKSCAQIVKTKRVPVEREIINVYDVFEI